MLSRLDGHTTRLVIMDTPAVISLSFSEDGIRLGWISNDHILRIWDGSKVLPPVKLAGARYLRFGTSLIAVSDDSAPVVRFVNANNLRVLTDANASIAQAGSVIALSTPQYSSNSIAGLFAIRSSSSVFVRTYGGQPVSSFESASVIFCASFHCDLTRLAVGDTEGVVRVWDLSSAAGTCVAVLQDHRSFVSAVAFSSIDTLLISAGWDGKAKVWDLNNPTSPPVQSTKPERAPSNKLHALVAAPSRATDSIFAAAGSTGTVRLWRLHHHKFQLVATHPDHSAQVYALAFSPDARHVASGCADGTVRILGVPTKPLLVSRPASSSQQLPEQISTTDAHSDADGRYLIRPMHMIIKGQRADRQLVFCPSNVVTLTCPICTLPYDDHSRIPICSGTCGHTYGCQLCNEKLWTATTNPSCPICRTDLIDVAPNYELVRILAAAKITATSSAYSDGPSASQSVEEHLHTSDTHYVKLERLSWIEAPELIYTTTHTATLYSGRMDGEVVGIRVHKTHHVTSSALLPSPSLDTDRHLRRLRSLRGPHIAQFYGISRAMPPDNRIVVVTELPIGGTLQHNLQFLRARQRFLSQNGLLMLSLQLVRALRLLHESDVFAGSAFSPQCIAVSEPIVSDWTAQHRLKIIEMGGSYSKSECAQDPPCTFASSFTPYLAPELLDEDRSKVQTRDDVFSAMQRCDMYTLGVVLWELASGNVPFEGLRAPQIVAAVIGRGERPGNPPSSAPEQLQSLISMLWSQRAEDRPDSQTACEMLETVPSAPAP